MLAKPLKQFAELSIPFVGFCFIHQNSLWGDVSNLSIPFVGFVKATASETLVANKSFNSLCRVLNLREKRHYGTNTVSFNSLCRVLTNNDAYPSESEYSFNSLCRVLMKSGVYKSLLVLDTFNSLCRVLQPGYGWKFWEVAELSIPFVGFSDV